MNETRLEELRIKAEKTLLEKGKDIIDTYKDHNIQSLLEEIAIYHAELEAQNDELREKTIELERSQNEHKLLYDHAPIGYIVLDTGYNIIRANIKAATQLHLSNQLLDYKRAIINYLGKGHMSSMLDWLKQDSGMESPLEVELLSGSQSRWFRLYKNYVDENRDLLLISLTDIHEEKLLKLELEKRIDAGILKIRQQETLLIQQSKMAEMGQMISAITHQWKQPLNTILLTVDVFDPENALNSELTQDEIQGYITEIKNQILFMSDTINDFRNYFVPSKELRDFSIVKAIESIYRIIRPKLLSTHIDVVIEGDPSVFVHGLQSEFKHVMMNLINNARDAITESGNKQGKIHIRVFREKQNAYIEIADNGGGIPENLLPDKLFEPYLSTKGDEGTGIGLSIGKSIIEKSMGGKLEAKNLPQGGACFTITLPIEYKTGGITLGKAILFVDDEEIVLNTMKQKLANLFQDVYTAKNGQEALELFEIHQEQLDLVLTDIDMPQMNGIELLQAIRNMGSTMPVIALTAISNETFEGDLFDLVLEKPIHQLRLIEKINSILHRSDP